MDDFELNMSFATLRDNQWIRLLNLLWEYPQVGGPFKTHFVPDKPVPETDAIRYPTPTATITQHGGLALKDREVRMDILVTRSLFECVSLTIPVSMLPDVESVSQIQEIFKGLALYVYGTVPFELATIGWDRGCQISIELLAEPEVRQILFEAGDFFIQDAVLKKLSLTPTTYQEVHAGLRWVSSKSSM